MYMGTYDLLAIIIALLSSITVMVLAIRQNSQLQRENLNLRRKIRIDRQAR
jgi:hypothetical protein